MDGERRDLTGREVVFLVGALERAGVRCWIDGGWGVDALLGRQTRTHDDLDLVVVSTDVDPLLLDVLAPLHFTIKEDLRPTRLVLRDHTDRQLDVHPIDVDPVTGDGRQRGAAADGGDARYPAADLGSGVIEGRRVPCISPVLQLAHHTGYEPTARDRADVAALCAAFPGLVAPPGYERRD
jgi:lincosamide nucleotidyltransferase A/C/D/E